MLEDGRADPLHAPLAFALALAVGLLIGLERERRPGGKAGIRTFTLIALAGTLAALIAQQIDAAWLVAVPLLVIGASLTTAYALDPDASSDVGTTTVAAAVVTYSLGAALWHGYVATAVALAITVAALLHFKTELEDFSLALTAQDVAVTLRFAALAFIVLPLLPDVDLGPYAAFNPRQVWWMVVLVSGVSWAGYAAWRLFGERGSGMRVAPLVGALGGLVSSTATTMIHARAARDDPASIDASVTVITAANLMLGLRLAIITAFAAPAMLGPLWPLIAGGLAGGVLPALWQWRRAAPTQAPHRLASLTNPASLRVALGFGAIYGAVLMGSAWLADAVGPGAVYAIAVASGLTDLDAIALSSLRLAGNGNLTATAAVTSIAFAWIANTALKAATTLALGGTALALRLAPVFVGTTAGILAAQALRGSP